MNPLNITPNVSLVRNKSHPEWGTWGIRFERKSEWYEIWNERGSRCLDFVEAADCWEVTL